MTDPQTVVQKLAGFVDGLALERIPPEVIAEARRCIMDTLGAIAAGQQPNLTADPTQPVETMTAFIVQVAMGDTPTGTIEYRTIFAVGIMLFGMTLVMNLLSRRLVKRYRA